MKRLLAILLATALLLLAGCGNTGASTENAASAEVSSAVQEEVAPAESVPAEEEAPAEADASVVEESVVEEVPGVEAKAPAEYPIAEDVTLSIFMAAPGGPPCVRESWADYELFDRGAEVTGVSLDWHEADMFTMSDQLQLLIASGDLPDIVAGMSMASGGLAGAYDNELIYDLKDYIEEYAPDYWNLTRVTNQLGKDLLTDEGYELCMPVIFDAVDAEDGIVCRQDWLDALGLEAPKTYDELENVLAAFKSEYNPTELFCLDRNLSMQDAWLCAGYGVGTYDVVDFNARTAFYLKDGSDTVTIALLEDGYKDYIEMLAGWYENGYLSKDFVSNSYNELDKQTMLCGNDMGFVRASADSLATFYSNAEDEGFALATLGLISTDGTMDVNHYCVNFQISSMADVSVSTTCDIPEIAVGFLNYWYTEDGAMLMNCGIEGETYNMVDGEISYTELVTANPDFPDMNANGMLMRYNCQGKICGIQMLHSKDSIYTQEQLDAIAAWEPILDNAWSMPYGVSLTIDETADVTDTLNSITTYASEQILAFVSGGRDISDWDSFVGEVKDMGLEDILAVYQGAYDRYNARS